MSSVAVIESKISSIQKYLKILKGYQHFSQDELENDVTLRGAVERYLYLITQACIDLAEAVIAFKDFRRPTTFSEAFNILEEDNLISSDLAEKLANMAKFRNIIAHDYEDIDFRIIYNVLQDHLEDIEEFVKQTTKKLDL